MKSAKQSQKNRLFILFILGTMVVSGCIRRKINFPFFPAPTFTPLLDFTPGVVFTSTPKPTIEILPTYTNTYTPSPTEPLPTETVTEIPVPTTTVTPSPTQTPPAPADPERIRFERGAISASTNFALNGKKQFAFRALANQVSTITVFPAGINLVVWGEDGTMLHNDQELYTSFWHGILPTNQVYYIQLSSDWAQEGELELIILPVGEKIHWFNYTNNNYHFQLQYPDYFVIDEDPLTTPSIKTEMVLNLNFVDSSFYQKTNLSEAAFVVGASTSSEQVATCAEPMDFYEEDLGEEVVGGLNFHKGYVAEPAAGNIYEQYIYRIANANTCYEIVFFMHSGNIGNYDPSLGINEFNKEAILQKMQDILTKFVLPG